MLAIVVGLLLTVSVALGIVVLVALPNLRQGSRILTPNGERAVKRAKQQAKQKPLAAAGSTWHGLIALKRLFARLGRQGSRIWAPVSSGLHSAMDRLEAGDTDHGTPRVDADTPDVRETASSTPHLGGGSSVGRPRDMPAISGPIPEISQNPPAQAPAAESGTGVESEDRSVDLRETKRSPARQQANQDTGGARPAR